MHKKTGCPFCNSEIDNMTMGRHLRENHPHILFRSDDHGHIRCGLCNRYVRRYPKLFEHYLAEHKDVIKGHKKRKRTAGLSSDKLPKGVPIIIIMPIAHKVEEVDGMLRAIWNLATRA